MRNLRQRVARLEYGDSPVPRVILVRLQEGETQEAALERHLEAHPWERPRQDEVVAILYHTGLFDLDGPDQPA